MKFASSFKPALARVIYEWRAGGSDLSLDPRLGLHFPTEDIEHFDGKCKNGQYVPPKETAPKGRPQRSQLCPQTGVSDKVVSAERDF